MRYLILATVLVSGAAIAQSDPSAQIQAVDSAFHQQRDAEQVAYEAQEKAKADAQARAQREYDKQQADIAAARAREQARADKEAAARRAKEAKDEAYRDQLRDIDVQQRKVQLQAAQTRVSRENEIIDAQLKRANAETDVVQSNADANRNISEGGKSFLQDSGKAAVKKASGWFN